MAYLALFLALGGGAYAAVAIDSADVENDSLHSRDLANDSGVKGKDVADGSLSGMDIADRSLAGPDIADDSLGGRQVNESSLTLGRDKTVLFGNASEPGGGALGEFWMAPSGTTVDSSGKPQITAQRSEATMVTPRQDGTLVATRIDSFYEVPVPAGGQRGIELIVNGAHTNLGCSTFEGQTGCTGSGSVEIPPGSEMSIKTFISTVPGNYGDYIRTALRLES